MLHFKSCYFAVLLAIVVHVCFAEKDISKGTLKVASALHEMQFKSQQNDINFKKMNKNNNYRLEFETKNRGGLSQFILSEHSLMKTNNHRLLVAFNMQCLKLKKMFSLKIKKITPKQRQKRLRWKMF